jgi:hypothetical protein
MAKSQFDRAKVFTDAESRGGPQIHVGGPLEHLRPEDRVVAVEFVVIQPAKDLLDPDKEDHNPARATRVRGSVKSSGNGRWDAIVPATGLRTGDAARGVGVVVIEQTDAYAYATVTWCDHIAAIETTTAAAVQEDLALLGASPAVQEDLAEPQAHDLPGVPEEQWPRDRFLD